MLGVSPLDSETTLVARGRAENIYITGVRNVTRTCGVHREWVVSGQLSFAVESGDFGTNDIRLSNWRG